MGGVNCGLQVKFLAGILFIYGLLLEIFTNESLSLTQES